jgi:L-2,4-diaminobutyrate decarboxylase
MSIPDPEPHSLLAVTLAAIEDDRRPEAGARFAELVSRAMDPSPPEAPAEHRGILGRSAGPGRFAEPPAEGRPLVAVLAGLERDFFDGSVWPGHRISMSAPLPAPLPASVWSEALIGAMNQSLRMQVMSPTGTLLETDLVRWMTRLVGWHGGAGGAFTSGATESSFTALLAARARVLPRAWSDGVGAEPPVVVAGPNVHFTIARALGELGLGTGRLDVVASRDQRLDPVALDRHLAEHAHSGRRVMAVVATAGAYVTGAFDDLQAIGAVCEAHRTWLHVDAAIGGTALLSATHRWRLAGIERASSVAWDLHKLAMLPLQAGVLLVRDERDLERAFAPPNEDDVPARPRSPHQGHRGFQNSRRLDALKLWVALERYGAAGLGALYDRVCALACELHRQAAAHRELEPLAAPESCLVVFRYVGERELDDAALDHLNQHICREAEFRRLAILSLTRVAGRSALVAVVMNPFLDGEALAALLGRLVALGGSLAPRAGRSGGPA